MAISSKAQFRATRERCGISQQMLADRFGRTVRTVKRWEKPGEADPPTDVQGWLEQMLESHVEAVRTALDAVAETAERQGGEPHHVDLLYYRSQSHYAEFGRDKGDYSIVNARSREIAVVLGTRGTDVRFIYPEDNEAEFQQLANTR